MFVNFNLKDESYNITVMTLLPVYCDTFIFTIKIIWRQEVFYCFFFINNNYICRKHGPLEAVKRKLSTNKHKTIILYYNITLNVRRQRYMPND